ncbi:MAG TPA: class I SAM-dependent methyltransferase [Pseudonocardiaceae bacterium]|nr:class I SAM-dependent methyltransferase [Pseudonocardiaceae bacterium]
MGEWQLFEPGTVPAHTTPEWYASRERAPHVDQAEHRGRLDIAAGFVGEVVREFGVVSLADLGAGDGGLLSLVVERMPEMRGAVWGYDLQQSNVDGARERGMNVFYGDVVDPDNGGRAPTTWGDIAVATEMLEHLVDPHAFVRRIRRHATWLIASSPHSERPGAAYEFHTWAWDLDGYRALVEQGGFAVQRQETWGPFQVILAHRA